MNQAGDGIREDRYSELRGEIVDHLDRPRSERPFVGLGIELPGVVGQDRRRVVRRIERNFDQMNGQTGDFLLQHMKVRRNERTHPRVSAARVNEGQEQRLPAKVLEAEPPAKLIEKRRRQGQRIPVNQRLNVVEDARYRAGGSPGPADYPDLVEAPWIDRRIDASRNPIAALETDENVFRIRLKDHRHRRHVTERLVADDHFVFSCENGHHDAAQVLSGTYSLRQHDERGQRHGC